jgi:general stress protein YciG
MSSKENNPGNFANRPKEEVSEIGRKGGESSHSGGFASMDPQQQVIISLIAKGSMTSRPRVGKHPRNLVMGINFQARKPVKPERKVDKRGSPNNDENGSSLDTKSPCNKNSAIFCMPKIETKSGGTRFDDQTGADD